jgi:predicted DNA-binding protein with PD1-like motif
MPRGFAVRRADPFSLTLALVEVQDGMDLVDALRAACEDWRPNPCIIFSALGAVRNAHVRVPVDAAMDEVVVDGAAFGVKCVEVYEGGL